MDHPLIDLIDARIAAARADGAFEGLAGAGKPLPRVDNPDRAVFDRVLKDAGAVPEAVSLSREIAALRARLGDTADRARRRALISEIAALQTRLDLVKRS